MDVSRSDVTGPPLPAPSEDWTIRYDDSNVDVAAAEVPDLTSSGIIRGAGKLVADDSMVEEDRDKLPVESVDLGQSVILVEDIMAEDNHTSVKAG